MANPWLRLYAEFAHDPKVQMMPENMQRRYVMLMCMRCSNDLVTLHETEIAFHLRITDVELAETKALFVSKGFIDEQWNLLNWDKRQFKSDSSSVRVSRHREKKKQECNGDVTLQKRQSNGLDTDTDTDTDKKKKHSRASGDALEYPEDFERFWSAYPRKKSKGNAFKAWKKINPSEHLAGVVLQAVQRATTSADWLKDGGQFIPHPASWLNARGWEDEGDQQQKRRVVV